MNLVQRTDIERPLFLNQSLKMFLALNFNNCVCVYKIYIYIYIYIYTHTHCGLGMLNMKILFYCPLHFQFRYFKLFKIYIGNSFIFIYGFYQSHPTSWIFSLILSLSRKLAIAHAASLPLFTTPMLSKGKVRCCITWY